MPEMLRCWPSRSQVGWGWVLTFTHDKAATGLVALKVWGKDGSYVTG